MNTEINLLSDNELDAVTGGVAMNTTNPIFLANGRGGNQVGGGLDVLEAFGHTLAETIVSAGKVGLLAGPISVVI